MDDCTQEAMLRCMHVLSITGCRSNNYRETDLNTYTSQVPNITVGPIITKKLKQKNLRKSLDREIYVISDPVPNFT